MEPLYSGEEMTKASLASICLRKSVAPEGSPSLSSTSWLYAGQLNSCIDASSTTPPCCSITRAAKRASRVLSDSTRNEAEKTRNRVGIDAPSTFDLFGNVAIQSSRNCQTRNLYIVLYGRFNYAVRAKPRPKELSGRYANDRQPHAN